MEVQNMESKFDGGILGFFGMSILSSALIAFTFGLALPWVMCLWMNWYVKHTIIDGHRLVFTGTGMSLFGNYIKWIILTVITFGIYGFWMTIKISQWIAKNTHLEK